MRSRLTFAVSR